MLQNVCQTSGYKKNMVYKIPRWGGGKQYLAIGLAFVTPDGLYLYKVMPFGMKKFSSKISTFYQRHNSWIVAL